MQDKTTPTVQLSLTLGRTMIDSLSVSVLALRLLYCRRSFLAIAVLFFLCYVEYRDEAEGLSVLLDDDR